MQERVVVMATDLTTLIDHNTAPDLQVRRRKTGERRAERQKSEVKESKQRRKKTMGGTERGSHEGKKKAKERSKEVIFERGGGK